MNRRIYYNDGTVMRVVGEGFGPSGDLADWWGKPMPPEQCSRENAARYVTVEGMEVTVPQPRAANRQPATRLGCARLLIGAGAPLRHASPQFGRWPDGRARFRCRDRADLRPHGMDQPPVRAADRSAPPVDRLLRGMAADLRWRAGWCRHPCSLGGVVMGAPVPAGLPDDSTKTADVADTRLWCMHVSGMDEVHPAPDRATAQRWAARWTADFARRVPDPGPSDPVMNFTVQEWPWSPQKHADGLANSIAGNTWPDDGDIDDLDSPAARLDMVHAALLGIVENPSRAAALAKAGLDFITLTAAERAAMRGEPWA